MAPGSLFVLFSLPLEAWVSTLPFRAVTFLRRHWPAFRPRRHCFVPCAFSLAFRKLSTPSRTFPHKRKDGQSPNMLSGEVREGVTGAWYRDANRYPCSPVERTARTEILNLEYITLPRRNAASLNQELAAMTRLGYGEDRFASSLEIAQGQRPGKQPTAQSPGSPRWGTSWEELWR